MNVSSLVSVLDCRGNDWKERAVQRTRSGQNFIAITGKSSATFTELSRLLESPAYLPSPLARWGIHALNDSLTVKDYKDLLEAEKNQEQIFLIEALRLPANQPPRLRAYLVYCEARGIVSHHETFEEAVAQLTKYFEGFHRAKMFPLAGVYRWQENEWKQIPAFKMVTAEAEAHHI